mgnify:CR=1 FL=1
MSETTTISNILTPGNVMFVIGLVGIVITVYRSIVNPQTASDKNSIKLEDRIKAVEKAVQEIKETHLRTVEQDIKNLTSSVNELSKTVVRLATIIDERIPKGTTATIN